LEVNSTSSSLVLPRMTTVQRDAISTPVEGGIIFNSTTKKVQVYEAPVAGQNYGNGTSTWYLYDGPAMGQTTQVQATGKLASITTKFAIRNADSEVTIRIYDAVGGNLIATSDNTVFGDWIGAEFNTQEGVWNFSSANITLNAGTTYYIQITAVSGSGIFVGSCADCNFYGEHFSGAIGSEAARTGYDLDLKISIEGSTGGWINLN